MTPEHIRLLYDYDAWANRRLLDACAALAPEQFTRGMGSSFPSVRDTLAHILGAEWLWLERWNGRMPTGLLPPQDFPDLASLRERWAQMERDLLEFVRRQTAEDLEHVYQIRTTRGEPFSHPLREMLQHVVNHGTYHRGQVTTLLRQLGAKAVSLDMSFFYRERGGTDGALELPALQLLYDYNAWANRRIVGACSALTTEQFTRDLGSSFPSVRDTLAHILGGEWIWLERWQGRSPKSLPTAADFPDLASLKRRWEEIGGNLLAFVGSLSAEQILVVNEYKTLTAGTFTSPLWRMLQHLANHGTYHRGQMTTMLRQSGAKAVGTDLITFYRERAAPAGA